MPVTASTTTTGRRNLLLSASSSHAISRPTPVYSIQAHAWSTFHRCFSSTLPGDLNDLSSNEKLGTTDTNDASERNVYPAGRAGNVNTSNESRVLEAAARDGRTAMELLKTTTSRPLAGNQGQYERRQSLKQAAKSLLSGTKATALLADTIAEIRERQASFTKKEEKSNDPGAVCLLELHKTFLNLAQDLLNCVDHDIATSPNSSSSGPRYYPKFPSDDQLVDLLLKLSYRAHQLSLSFTWPLYQRMAIVMAKQPNFSTLRSRAEWIWSIYQWSHTDWGTPGKTSTIQSTDEVDIDWLRHSLLELAKHQHWSDLSYLLRNILHPIFRSDPPFISARQHRHHHQQQRRRRKNREYTAIAFVEEVNESGSHQPQVLDEGLVRELLLALDDHGVLSSLWKNLHNPSVVEEDILEILLLMESSIWEIFAFEPDAAARTLSLQKERQSGAWKPGETPKASLRDAIDILLQTSVESDPSATSGNEVSNPDDEDLGRTYDGEHDETLQLFLDVKDILEEANDLEDDSDEYDQDSVDALVLAALLFDQKLPRITRDLEVRARRSGDNQFLEMPGLADRGVNAFSADYFDAQGDMGQHGDATDVIYSRDAGYQDDIPDVASQIYQHNGNRALRYRCDFEYEIYESLRQSDEDFEWSETFFADGL